MKKESYNLTNPQKNIWNSELFFRNSNINNVCGSSLIKEKIDFDLLKKAFILFAQQNDCFQTRFFLDENNSPMQYFADFEPFDVEVVDVDDSKSFNFKDYTQSQSIVELIDDINKIDVDNLSITEAYQFIEDLKQKVIKMN